MATRTEIDAVPKELEGAFFAGNHVAKEFSRRYIDIHRDDSHIAHAGSAYVFGDLLASVISGSTGEPLTNEAIVTGFSAVELSEGPLGVADRKIGPDGEISLKFPVVMRAVYQGHAQDL